LIKKLSMQTLHYSERMVINQMKALQKKTMQKKTIRQVSQTALDAYSMAQFQAIANRYASVKNYVASRYNGPKSLVLLTRYRQTIRPELNHSDFSENCGLSTRYWQLALDEAIAGIKAEWSNTKNRVRQAVRLNNNLSENEKHYINFVLHWNDVLSAICCYHDFVAPDKLPDIGNREHAIHNLTRRYVRRYKGHASIAKKKRSFMIDSSMYRYQNGQIEIAGLISGKRLRIPLTDKNKHKGVLRVVLLSDGRLEIHKCKSVRCNTLLSKTKKNERILAIDKGYTSLFATNTDREYGMTLGVLLSAETERLNVKNKRRNAIWAQMHTLEQTGDHVKANRIRDNNFGYLKYNHQKRQHNEQLINLINHSIRAMLLIEQPNRVIVEELNFNSWSRKMPKHIKRNLSRWVKGVIQTRIDYICESYNIPIEKVNPAHTSQICCKCGKFGKRVGKTFTCPTCGRSDADINAAHNIHDRYFDKEINPYTPYQQVKVILQKRLLTTAA